MDIIINLSNKFKELVLEHIKQTDNSIKIIQIEKNDDLKLKHDTIYTKNNYCIISNKILKKIYKDDSICILLKENEYSVVNILYRNIKWRERDGINLCYLEKRTKEQNVDIMKGLYNTKINTEYIIMIGRKYYNKITDEKNNNCFDLVCLDKIEQKDIDIEKMDIDIEIKEMDKMDIDDDIDTESVNMIKSGIYRTKFLKQLKTYIYGEEKRNFYIKNEMKRSIFLDVEFINDIYDDFETFPLSKDLSILFMIGLYYYDDESKKFVYKNLVTKQLDTINEYSILKEYLGVIENINIKTSGKVNIFHWSNADLWAINRGINKHEDLINKNNNLNVVYIDLLKLIKAIVKFESYSLKSVSKKLLDKIYHTECQNGLDAMMSMISKTEQITKIDDLIEYNKLDTTIMYDIVNEFVKIT